MEEQKTISFLLKYKLSGTLLFQQWQHSHQVGVMMQYIIKTQRENYKQPHLRKKVQLYNSNKHMVYIIMVRVSPKIMIL